MLQSCAIFSGTQVWGTIEKPRRTKNAGSWANAVSLPIALATGANGQLFDHADADAETTRIAADDERSHFGDLRRQRRELRATNDLPAGHGHDKARRMDRELIERARQEPAFLEMGGNQRVQRGGVGGDRRAQHDLRLR